MKRLAALVAVWILVACGGGGGGGTGGGDIPPPSGPPTLAMFAGLIRSNIDGMGAAAGFDRQVGVATDGAGNVYVADTFHHTIRKITPAGVVSTLAGTTGVAGSADGMGTAARFNYPDGLATDSAGNVYVADTFNHTIRKITPAGLVSTWAGATRVAGISDGMGEAARFNHPEGIATDSAGNVFVADRDSHTIRKINPAGLVSTLAGNALIRGGVDGTGAEATFNFPNGVAADSAGNVYVADTSNHTIRKITPAGLVSTWAGTNGVDGNADGPGTAARFSYPKGITTDSRGNVYVAAADTIRKVTSAGIVSTLAGTANVEGSVDGTGAEATFKYPNGLATDSAGNVYVADTYNSTIRMITPSGLVSTLAGHSVDSGSADGIGVAARFSGPLGITTDSTGNVYVADIGNHTIRKITPAGVVSTLAGTAGAFGSADGMGSAARFVYPWGVATDSAGNVYVGDSGNHTIRKITPAGFVSTLAGKSAVVGSADGLGAAATFNRPAAIATDSAGNVYVADLDNHTIRKITPAGAVSTLAGSAGVAGNADGMGAAARFNLPTGLTTDSAGNVYVGDESGTVRKITPDGLVSTMAWITRVKNDPRYSKPWGITTDSAGNIYSADAPSNVIRKITPAGVVSNLVGGSAVYAFEAGPLPGAVYQPKYLAISGNTLYITTENGVAVVTNLPQ